MKSVPQKFQKYPALETLRIIHLVCTQIFQKTNISSLVVFHAAILLPHFPWMDGLIIFSNQLSFGFSPQNWF